MVSTSVLFLNERLIPGSGTMASTVLLLVATYLLGFLMVSTVPYTSFKDMEITRTKPMAVIFVSIVDCDHHRHSSGAHAVFTLIGLRVVRTRSISGS